MRKICIITTTRAEYGLLYWLMKGLQSDPEIIFQLVVTGTHISIDFGSTIDQIREDGFQVDRSFSIELTDDSAAGIIHSQSVALEGFSTAFSTLKPDIVVLLGDRFELLAAASAALVYNIPIAHIHGGELTQGAIDDSVRHAITKMSHWHFTATKVYRDRVIQMGEDPSRVFHVGGMGQDNIRKLTLLTKDELQENLGFSFAKRNLLITYHPETLDTEAGIKHFGDLLFVLKNLHNTLLILTKPNADAGNAALNDLLEEFVNQHPANSRLYTSLGQIRYLSVMKYVDAVVGNSSSGIIEAPSMKTATINIGDRQKGRISAGSVIHTKPDKSSITKAFKTLYSQSFQKKLQTIINPYGNGGASEKILKILRTIKLNNNLQKPFHDIKPQ